MRGLVLFHSAAVFLGFASEAAAAVTRRHATEGNGNCRTFPGECSWPKEDLWKQLNETVGGRLIATVPLAKACHDPDYDAATCAWLQTYWSNPMPHLYSSSSIMSPFFTNGSCDAFTPREQPCTMGNYVHYAVEVLTADHVRAAIAFAQAHNIRFVIRNTGHDYMGRSTGAGALAIWTWKLNTVDIMDWNDDWHQGKAVKFGAGVRGYEIMEALKGKGLVTLGGECPTVGVAGGYTQGGGHSALSTEFGLGADNTLEWEVVTADGRVVKASRTENSDLYWALSGGGAGNWGVVLSLIVRAFPDAPIGSAMIQFTPSQNPNGRFWKAIDVFHAHLPALVDAGAMVIYTLTGQYFSMAPLTAYNKTAAEVSKMIAPLLASLDKLGVPYTQYVTQAPTYYDHYAGYFGPLPFGKVTLGIINESGRGGGWLLPRRSFESTATINDNTTVPGATLELAKTIQYVVEEQGATWVGVSANVTRFGDVKRNAVLPAWRDSLMHIIVTTPLRGDWAMKSMEEGMEDAMTTTIIPALQKLAPESGSYMNEGDFRQREFQKAFYGENYARLQEVKRKWDPEGFFWGVTGVGSEAWSIKMDGRLCKK